MSFHDKVCEATEVGGGQAFPITLKVSDDQIGILGLTKREYFAAHAPKRVPFWFVPTMPPRPALAGKERNIFDDDQDTPEMMKEYALYEESVKLRNEWQQECNRQLVIQWPRYYADALLDALSKTGGAE